MTATRITRAIAFDWGGVFTVGTFDGRSTGRLAERYGLDVNVVRQHYFALVHQLELGSWSLPQFWTEFSGRIGLSTVPYEDFEALYVGSVLENERMYSFLPGIPRRFRVGLLSNNYPVIADHLDADPRWARFDARVFSNRIGVKKPDPQAFQALSDALGVAPSGTIFIDDVQENLDAAAALGFQTILYATNEHPRFLSELEAWMRQS
jgi:putative hydrolase of the HAD superfamily